MKLIRVHSSKQRKRGKVISESLINNITDRRGTNTNPPTQTNLLKTKFYSLPKTIRVLCVVLLVVIGTAIIACVVIFTHIKKAESDSSDSTDSPPDVDSDYFGDHLGTHPIYYRDSWGGEPPHDKIPFKRPPKVVLISHTASSFCKTIDECSKILKQLQADHMARNWNDIGYNFMIGGDGAIFVGRGWNSTSFHMMSEYNVGISFIGNFNEDFLNEEMIQAAKLLMDKGLDMDAIAVDYQVVGQNQTTKYQPTSPGTNVVEVIKKWPRYSSIIFFKH
ncbi:unnamed protein product [Acanthoscelides obtectus]|uniref:Uncharacterized protein n=1 Tax=Acanthoscelides obtectus TaxID=200917 RepID=A0A9P0PWX4_ACAOB|nr:unnamed protein product [Acanthoscelides obtectus]CAK1642363.1 Peptidoglycan-recognition protein LF [Acanthoscelides obtectus]